MSKRAVLLLLSIILVLGASISGTLAYLTGEDEVVNVMTAGRVEITQQEQQRNPSGQLEPFVQNPSFLPAVYEGNAIPLDNSSANWPKPDPAWQTLAANNAVVDKFVTVTNEGNVPAYVRTVVALESPGKSAGGAAKWVHINDNSSDTGLSVTLVKDVAVGDTLYDAYIYTYQNPLEPNDTTIPSLKQLYMDKACTTEDMQQIGSRYEVLVLSQGVQTTGFDDADSALNQSFGQPTTDHLAQWLAAVVSGDNNTDSDSGNDNNNDNSNNDTPGSEATPITVTSTEALNAALAKVPERGSITIQLAESAAPYTAPANATNKTITLTGDKGATLQMVTNPNASSASDPSFTGSHLRLEGITVCGAPSDSNQGFACASLDLVDCTVQYSMTLFAPATFTHCTFDKFAPSRYHIETNGQNATFTDCTFDTYGNAVHVSSPAARQSTIKASRCFFTDNTNGSQNKAVFVVDDSNTSASYQLIFSDCTITGFVPGKNTSSTLWSNENNIPPTRLSVTIDDASVY